MGVMTYGPVRRNIKFFMGNDPGKGHQPAPERFSQHQNIRRHKMFTGKHFAGAAEALDDLIENQQSTVLLTELLNALPVSFGRNDRRG